MHKADAEVNIIELWAELKNRKVWIVGLSIISSIVAALATSLVAPKWYAEGIIQIGQVRNEFPIESKESVIQRIKSRSFQNEVVRRANVKSDSDAERRRFRYSIEASALANSSLIRVTSESYSAEHARALLAGAWEMVRDKHHQMLRPHIQLLARHRDELRAQIERIKSARRSISKREGVGQQAPFATYLDLQTIKELQSLEEQHMALEQQLTPFFLRETSLLADPTVELIAPGRLRNAIYGGLGGFVVSVFVVIFLYGSRSLRKN